MEISVNFAGGRVVEAVLGDHVVKTDQPVKDGGTNTAPYPFELFLASIATCSAYYVLDFCLERKISTAGIAVTMKIIRNQEGGRIAKIATEIKLPPEFPEKYEKAVVRAADSCSVKKYIFAPPEFETYTSRK
jgi:ribosomal protein S12 methylthiotransferase accessory factor